MPDIIDSIALGDIKTAFFKNFKSYLAHLLDPNSAEPVILNSTEFHKSFFNSGLSLPQFNGLFLERINELDSLVETNENSISTFGNPFHLWFHPRNDGKELNTKLKPLGYRYIGDDVGVVIEISKMNKQISYPKSLYIEPVNNEDRMAKWLEVAKLKFNYRGENHIEYFGRFKGLDFKEKRYWTKYIGWLNGEPSVIGTLILAGGIAVVYDEALLTHLQRNRWGIDDGLVLKVMMDALASGYKIGGVLSSVGELRKYFKLGFEENCRLSKFIATTPKK